MPKEDGEIPAEMTENAQAAPEESQKVKAEGAPAKTE